LEFLKTSGIINKNTIYQEDGFADDGSPLYTVFFDNSEDANNAYDAIYGNKTNINKSEEMNVSKTTEMKKILSEYFTEYIMSLTDKELHEFIISCSNSIKQDLDNSCKPFNIPEPIFTCQKCELKYGDCAEENTHRELNGKECVCFERFMRYCTEDINLEKEYPKYISLLCKIEGVDIENQEQAHEKIMELYNFSSDLDMYQKMECILSKFNPKQQLAIKMHYGLGYEHTYTLDEIGRKLNLSKERIRSLCNEVINQIKQPSYYQELTLKEIKPEKLEDLEFSLRTYNAIRRCGIQTISELMDVVNNNPERLRKTRTLGVKCMEEILEKVGRLHL